MNEKENEVFEKLKQDAYKLQINYQWGGEPNSMYKKEVLTTNLLCFHDNRVKELLKEKLLLETRRLNK